MYFKKYCLEHQLALAIQNPFNSIHNNCMHAACWMSLISGNWADFEKCKIFSSKQQDDNSRWWWLWWRQWCFLMAMFSPETLSETWMNSNIFNSTKAVAAAAAAWCLVYTIITSLNDDCSLFVLMLSSSCGFRVQFAYSVYTTLNINNNNYSNAHRHTLTLAHNR